VPDIAIFTMLVCHFGFAGEVFSVDLSLPVWWEIVLVNFFGLMDPNTSSKGD